MMINVLADQHLYNIRAYLPENINLQLFDPTNGLPQNLENIDALLIRTVLSINEQTLPDIPGRLSFVGTASAGTDHVDIPYLEKHNVKFANSAGCNARSVAEYVATALLLWAEQRKINLQPLSLGIIGVGQVGQQVSQLMDSLGISTVEYDPPREKREHHFQSASLTTLLDCELLTFHTPLTTSGPHATCHWLDEEKLSGQQFELIINTARGGVIDERAVLASMQKNSISDIIIDVWEEEPDIRLKTAEQTYLRTPHIAGYSVQAKNNASKFVSDHMIHHFELEPPTKKEQSKPRIINNDISDFYSFSSLLCELHPIMEYQSKLDDILNNHTNERGTLFNKLRATFPLREEFAHTYLPEAYFKKFPVLDALGFSEMTKLPNRELH